MNGEWCCRGYHYGILQVHLTHPDGCSLEADGEKKGGDVFALLAMLNDRVR